MVSTMSVTVLLFASYADAFGQPSLELHLPAGATVSDLIRHVSALPSATALPPKPLVAVNARYASGDQLLNTGDEIALIPPVAGG